MLCSTKQCNWKQLDWLWHRSGSPSLYMFVSKLYFYMVWFWNKLKSNKSESNINKYRSRNGGSRHVAWLYAWNIEKEHIIKIFDIFLIQRKTFGFSLLTKKMFIMLVSCFFRCKQLGRGWGGTCIPYLPSVQYNQTRSALCYQEVRWYGGGGGGGGGGDDACVYLSLRP